MPELLPEVPIPDVPPDPPVAELPLVPPVPVVAPGAEAADSEPSGRVAVALPVVPVAVLDEEVLPGAPDVVVLGVVGVLEDLLSLLPQPTTAAATNTTTRECLSMAKTSLI